MLMQHVSNNYDKLLDGQKRPCFQRRHRGLRWDRNFVRSDSDKWSIASSVWRPSWRMNAAWDEWLSSMGNAYEVVQPEFT